MVTLLKDFSVPIFYSIGIIIFLLSISGKVKYGIFFLVPLLPLQNVLNKIQQLPMGKDFNDMLFIGMIIGWILYKTSHNERIFRTTAFNTIILLYVVYTYISLWKGSGYLGYPPPVSALDPRVQNWKNQMLLPLLFLLVFNNINTMVGVKRIFMLMCLSMFLMDLYTIRQISWITAWFNRTKLHGTFVWLGPNEVAAFYATYTFVVLGIFLFIKERIPRIILCILMMLNLYCIIFLFSRGAYLATLSGFILIGIMRIRKLLIIPIIVLIFWQTVLPQQVVERIQFTEQEDGQLDASAQTRLVLWQESMGYFTENPFFGVGFDVFHNLGLKRDTHNIYFRTLAEQGIFGLLFIVLIMGFAFNKGWQLYKKTDDKFLKGLGLGFCACLISSMVGNFFGDRWTHLSLGAFFWVFLGLVCRGINLSNEERMKTSRSKHGMLRETVPLINHT